MSWLARRLVVSLAALAGVFVLAGFLSGGPAGFIPTEDQGYFFVNVKLPNSASLERTQTVLDHMTGIVRKDPGVANVIKLAGFSLVTSTNASNAGSIIAILKPWASGRRRASRRWASSRR